MLIPTEQDFLESMEALAQPIPKAILGQFTTSLIHEPNSQNAKKLIREIYEWDAEQLQKTTQLKAAKWFVGDRLVERAYEAVKKRTAGLHTDAAVEILLKRLKPRANPRRPESYFRWVEVQLAYDSLYSYKRVWLLAVLCSFKEYYFNPDAIELLIRQKKQLEDLKRSAQQGIDAHYEIAMHALPLGSTFSTPYDSNKKVIASRKSHDIRRLHRLSLEASSLIPPIQRNDATAKERLLVFRLWEAHMNIFRHPRTRAIQILLLLEGVKHQMDERRIERLCASFKTSHKKLIHHKAAPRLFAKIRGDKYREEMSSIYENSVREEEAAKIGPQQPLPEAL